MIINMVKYTHETHNGKNSGGLLVTHAPSPNTVFTLQACTGVTSATPSHRAASAAKEKCSDGPVRRRRENETLAAIIGGYPL